VALTASYASRVHVAERKEMTMKVAPCIFFRLVATFD